MPAAHGRYSKAAGFTLLEILVVVLIIGVLSAVFLLSVDSNREEKGKHEAQRFAALMKLAGQEAMLRSRELAVEIFPDGYRFLVSEEQQWQPLEDDILTPQQLPEGMSLLLQFDGADVAWADAQEVEAPRIYLLSTGEMTPFELTLLIEGLDYSYRVNGGVSGKLGFSEQR